MLQQEVLIAQLQEQHFQQYMQQVYQQQLAAQQQHMQFHNHHSNHVLPGKHTEICQHNPANTRWVAAHVDVQAQCISVMPLTSNCNCSFQLIKVLSKKKTPAKPAYAMLQWSHCNFKPTQALAILNIEM